MVEYDKADADETDRECYFGVAIKMNSDRMLTEHLLEKMDKKLGHAWMHGKEFQARPFVRGARTSNNYMDKDGIAIVTYAIDTPKEITVEEVYDFEAEIRSGISMDITEIQFNVTGTIPDDPKWFRVS